MKGPRIAATFPANWDKQITNAQKAIRHNRIYAFDSNTIGHCKLITAHAHGALREAFSSA